MQAAVAVVPTICKAVSPNRKHGVTVRAPSLDGQIVGISTEGLIDLYGDVHQAPKRSCKVLNRPSERAQAWIQYCGQHPFAPL